MHKYIIMGVQGSGKGTQAKLLAAACSGASGANGDAPAQASTTTAVSLQPLEQPSSRCGAPDCA